MAPLVSSWAATGRREVWCEEKGWWLRHEFQDILRPAQWRGANTTINSGELIIRSNSSTKAPHPEQFKRTALYEKLCHLPTFLDYGILEKMWRISSSLPANLLSVRGLEWERSIENVKSSCKKYVVCCQDIPSATTITGLKSLRALHSHVNDERSFSNSTPPKQAGPEQERRIERRREEIDGNCIITCLTYVAFLHDFIHPMINPPR